MSDNLRGSYNLVICNECGTAASIILDHLMHNVYACSWIPFCVKDLENEMLFISNEELIFGLSKLISKGYVCGSVEKNMYIAKKSFIFLPNNKE